MKKLLAALTVFSAVFTSTTAYAGAEPYIGEIMTFAGNFCPQGYQIADGHILSIAQNQVLFSLLGNNYGGDGYTTFAVPNIKPVLTVNRTYLMSCIAVDGIYPSHN